MKNEQLHTSTFKFSHFN